MRRWTWLVGAIALVIACDAKVEPVKPEPVKAEPVIEPVKAEPVKAEPVKAEPVKAEPVKTEGAPVEGTPVEAKAEEAKAGATPAEAKVEEAKAAEAKPVTPKGSVPEQLRCARDSDCEFVSRPCTCEPCGEYWREVMNKAAHRELQSKWAVRKCKKLACPTCVSKRLGTKAVCVRGKCEAR
jgi:hypothetical protein